MAASFVPIGGSGTVLVIKEDGERLDKDITLCCRFTGIGYSNPLTTEQIGQLAYELNRIYWTRTGKTPMHITWRGEPKYVDLPAPDVDASACVWCDGTCNGDCL